MTLRFLPEVEEDVISSYAWYESKAPGLGEEFLRMFYASAAEIPRNPMLFQKIYGDFRRRLLPRFPYAIHFIEKNEDIIVIVLFHCARDPRTIKNKLIKRNDPLS